MNEEIEEYYEELYRLYIDENQPLERRYRQLRESLERVVREKIQGNSLQTTDYFPIFMSKKSPIDYIFVTKATVAPQVYRVLNHRVNGRFASDHYAIYADVVMK